MWYFIHITIGSVLVEMCYMANTVIQLSSSQQHTRATLARYQRVLHNKCPTAGRSPNLIKGQAVVPRPSTAPGLGLGGILHTCG